MKTTITTFRIMLLLMFFAVSSNAQTDTSIGNVINSYAKVTAMSQCLNSVDVDTLGDFSTGDRVLIIQMKGASVYTTSIPSGKTYGDVASHGNAGHYDFNEILSISGNTITLKYQLQRTYDIPGMVQIVRVPVYNQPVVNITSTLTCLPWNVNTGKGGVLVFEAPNSQVNLMADINVDGMGFAGGSVSNNGTDSCNTGDFFPSTTTDGGFKGETYAAIPTGHECGKGKIGGGGGGGNDQNAGGGGGGGAAVLGVGGLGGTPYGGTYCNANGVGGLDLLAFSDGDMFLGSGGGGGHQNNTSGGSGGNGGGIIMITANTVNIPGTASQKISANGNNGVTSVYFPGQPTYGDGAGGGGGGGTIYMQCGSFTSTLTGGANGILYIYARGGNGGNVTSTAVHGPGGGGGGGKTYFYPSPASWGPANTGLSYSGGNPGIKLNDSTTRMATAGHQGHFRNDLRFNYDSVLYQPLVATVNGVDSIVACLDKPLSFSVTGGTGDSNAVYTWTGPGISPVNGKTFTITKATTSHQGIFYVTHNGCTDSIYVVVQLCCPANEAGSGYTIINAVTDGPITTDVIWGSKIFITGGVLQVTGDVTLDATNSDVVFDECAGLELLDGAIIRANNSVFRPCVTSIAWSGITIKTTGNIFDECTFKNATDALRIREGGAAKIHSDLFLNNNTGVNIDGTYDYPYSISGNRFVIDEEVPDFGSCGGSNASFRGIYSINSSHKENISQNEFINYNVQDLNQFKGIALFNSYANITSNTFTNMYRAIDVVANNGQVHIENNNIEINKEQNATILYQVALSDGDAPVLIFNNTISDPNDYTANTVDNAAVYANKQQYLYLKSNTINGFETGIELYEVNNSLISENKIYNSQIGIYSMLCNALHISCNEIDLDFGVQPALCTGIYCYEIDGNSRIHSNCIVDCQRAIELYSGAPGANLLPAVQNNFMYNYSAYGVFSNGYSGNIGTGSGDGMNTFYSNSGAWDLFAFNGTINCQDNFGLTSISGGNTGGSQIHSTASCGKHTQPFGSMQNQLNYELVCNDYNAVIEPLYMESGEIRISADKSDIRNSIDVYAGISAINAVAYDRREVETAYDVYNRQMSLTMSQQQMLQYTHEQAMGNKYEAMTLLTTFEPADKDELLWKETEQVQIDQQNGIAPGIQQLDYLKTNFSDKDGAINRVNSILIPYFKVADLYFRKKVIADDSGTENPKGFNLGNKMLELNPNPVRDVLNVRYVLGTGDDHRLVIVNMLGVTVLTVELPFDAGQTTVQLNDLPSGLYTAYIPGTSGEVQMVKVVKQ